MATRRKTADVLKRFVLPSGKTVEVLRQSPPPASGSGGDLQAEPRHAEPVEPSLGSEAHGDTAATPAPGDAGVGGPHVCPECGSSLVYPTAWCESGGGRWNVDLRCPNCERTETAILDTEVAESFDEELERGAEMLTSDLARLTEANMLEELERFVTALDVDAIVPLDF